MTEFILDRKSSSSDSSSAVTTMSHPLVSVVDVYDEAASIGKDFEIIIQQYGVESVSQLMPRVINVLEQLELFAASHEQENREVEELRYLVDKLEVEKHCRLNERNKYEKELEQIEDSWRKQVEELSATTRNMHEQNDKLKAALEDAESQFHSEAQTETSNDKVFELEMSAKVSELEAAKRQQSSENKQLQRELRQKNLQLESLQVQLDVVARENAFLRKRSSQSTRDIDVLVKERCELEERLQRKEDEVHIMQDYLQSPSTSSNVSQIQSPENEDGPTTPIPPASFDSQNQADDTPKLEAMPHAADPYKVVYDRRDPNCPRFTTQELRKVLMQRNELRTKLVAVQEELDMLRPRRTQSNHASVSSVDSAGDDAPVQGPINREPYDKLYPDSTGIRKFFGFLFSPKHSKSSSPATPKRRGIGVHV